AVTHDRYFLDNVAGWILELDRGRGIPYEGNYSGWLEQKQARLAVEEKQSSARQRTLQRELEWVRMAPKARHAKTKARRRADETCDDDEFSCSDTVVHSYGDQSRHKHDTNSKLRKELSGGQKVIVREQQESQSRKCTSWYHFRFGDQ